MCVLGGAKGNVCAFLFSFCEPKTFLKNNFFFFYILFFNESSWKA